MISPEKAMPFIFSAVNLIHVLLHPQATFAQEILRDSYYEGNTQVEIFGRNTIRSTKFCGWEGENPTGRQYTDVEVRSNDLSAGETVVFAMANEETREVVRKEIHGGGPPGSDFTTHHLPLGTWVFTITDRGQTIPAGAKTFICLPDIDFEERRRESMTNDLAE